jgi:D-glycero-alpha-D-manno-heptose-7-phosphate kinase
LAEEACKIELIGKPIGKQDQYAAAFGGIIVLEIDQKGNVAVTPLNLEEAVCELEQRLIMFYAKIQHDANEILAEQSEKAKVDENVGVKAMHWIKEIGIEIGSALQQGDVDEFGRLMHEHWIEKKKVSDKMTKPMIDSWYEKAIQKGALGGKVMGADGGGFLLLCCEHAKHKQLRSAMEAKGLRYMDFRFDWEGSKVLVNF